MSISVAALIRPAKGAMVLSAVLTALSAIVTLVPFVVADGEGVRPRLRVAEEGSEAVALWLWLWWTLWFE